MENRIYELADAKQAGVVEGCKKAFDDNAEKASGKLVALFCKVFKR